MNVGSRIRQLREQRGFTLEEVGVAIGVTKATVQRYESGEIDIKRTVAIRLAEILNTSPAYIMGWSDDSSAVQKYPAANDDNGIGELRSEVIGRLRKLTPEEWVLVDTFVQGILASRSEK